MEIQTVAAMIIDELIFKALNVKDIIDVVLNRFQKERVQLDVQDSESKISSKIQNECANTNDLYAQLEKLGQLKEKGILTEEEFKQQKEKPKIRNYHPIHD